MNKYYINEKFVFVFVQSWVGNFLDIIKTGDCTLFNVVEIQSLS